MNAATIFDTVIVVKSLESIFLASFLVASLHFVVPRKPKTNVYDYTRNLRNIAMRLADPPMHRPRGTTDIVRCGKMSFAHMVT